MNSPSEQRRRRRRPQTSRTPAGREHADPDEELRALREKLQLEHLALDAEHQAVIESQRQLEISRDQYADLFDFAPAGFAILDRAGNIQNINLTGAALLRRDRLHLLEKPLVVMMGKSDRRRFSEHLAKVRRSDTEVRIELLFHCQNAPDVLLEFTSLKARPGVGGPWHIRTAFRDVTGMRRAEEAERVAQAELKFVTEFAPVMLARCTRELRYSYVNQTCARFLGLSREEIVGKHISEILGESAFKAIQPYVEKVLRGQSVEYELDVAYAGMAGTRYMRVAYQPERNQEGQVVGWVAALADITDRKQAEIQLRRAHQELELRVAERTAQLQETLARVNDLYHHAPCGYHSLDSNGVFVEINDTALRLLGYTRAELIGKKTAWDVQTPRSRKIGKAAFQKFLEQGSIRDVELEFMRKDGSVVPTLLNATAVRDANGRFLRTRSTFIDLTLRKEMEKALRDTEARLQAIVDHSPQLIFLKDLQGRYLHYNQQFARTLGLAPGQGIGKTDFQILPREQAAASSFQDKQVIDTERPIQSEHVTTDKDDTHTNIVSKFPIRDAEGKMYAVGGIITDITERKRLEAEVLQISEYEKMRIAQDLHDGLGQQLAGTWFLSDTLQKALEAQGSPESAAAAQIAKLLETAVGQIRNLARGLFPVPSESNGLMSALEKLAAQVSAQFRVRCQFLCPQPVLIDNNEIALHFFRIAQEAINNAIRHGKAATIRVELSSADGRVVLKVADNGTGFRKSSEQNEGIGLRTMRYRADLIGANFAIAKARPNGVEVMCSYAIGPRLWAQP